MAMTAVARAAGVSTATVSRVLNGSPGVRAETVEQVRAAAKALNYTLPAEREGAAPRRRGRSPRGSRTGNLAIITIGHSREWLQLPILATVVAGVQRAASEAGMRLLLDEVPDMGKSSALITEHRIDGAVVLVSSDVQNDSAVRFLSDVSKQMPVVWAMGAPLGADGLDHVTYDSMGVGRLAYLYLKDAGCEDFAYFTDHPEWRLLRLRGQAFCNAAFDDRKRPESFIVTEDELLTESFGHNVTRAADFDGCVEAMIKGSKQRPLGIFVANDATAGPLYFKLMQAGVRLGIDVKVVSCDNEEIRLSTLHPRPASIDCGGAEIGYRAVSRVLMRKQRPTGAPVVIHVQPTLIS